MADFQKGRIHCAECVLKTMADFFGVSDPAIPRIATAFGGGIAGKQDVCGAYAGGAMIIGMRMGRDHPGGDREQAVAACAALRSFITERYGGVDCRSIIGEWDFATQREAFRAEGGMHQMVCEPLVAAVCRYLATDCDSENADEGD
jgi:C_GCAxxG_C_C family probable redox protein